MIYHDAKVYNDGSHYIAIPHTVRPSTARKKLIEDTVVSLATHEDSVEQESFLEPQNPHTKDDDNINNNSIEKKAIVLESKLEPIKSKKEVFESLYAKHINLKIKDIKL